MEAIVTAPGEAGGPPFHAHFRAEGTVLSFARVLELWRGEGNFLRLFRDTLAAAPGEAWLWETPAVTKDTLGRPFEFVLVPAPALARMPVDPRAFESAFDAGARARGVTSFDNLGGDARLVAPCPPVEPAEPTTRELAPYGHLAAFTRALPLAPQAALWQCVADQLEARLGDEPVWLSTSGLGIAWLHVRLDERPKYYAHAPFRSPARRAFAHEPEPDPRWRE